jgi:hypothetical protein
MAQTSVTGERQQVAAVVQELVDDVAVRDRDEADQREQSDREQRPRPQFGERDRRRVNRALAWIRVRPFRHVLPPDCTRSPPDRPAARTARPTSRANHIVGVKRRDRTSSGDAIYLGDGGWDAAVLESSDRGSYVANLQLISELDFDVLAPWIATGGQPGHAITDATEARRRISGVRDRVRS